MAERPCEKGLSCSYEYYDYSEDCMACGIDFDGTACPYVKPWGKKKWEREQVEGRNYGEKID